MMRTMKLAPACLLGIPLLIGSAVLARAAFVPDAIEPASINVVDVVQCGQAAVGTGVMQAAGLHAEAPGCAAPARRAP